MRCFETLEVFRLFALQKIMLEVTNLAKFQTQICCSTEIVIFFINQSKHLTYGTKRSAPWFRTIKAKLQHSVQLNYQVH